jgi:DNA-binding response OmpR family regulator
MLVDDSADTLTTLSRGLSRHNLHVTSYSDPQLALAEFEPNHYDMVILDLSMPNMNGFELAKNILIKDSDVRICILSAFDADEVEVKKRFKGAKSIGFLKKPILTSKLAIIVNNVISGKE